MRNKWNKGRDVQIQAFLLGHHGRQAHHLGHDKVSQFLGVFLDKLSGLVGILGAPVVEHGLLYWPPEREDGLCFGRKMGMEKEGMLQDSGGKIKHFNKISRRCGYVLLCRI